jgi:hypothetical protein
MSSPMTREVVCELAWRTPPEAAVYHTDDDFVRRCKFWPGEETAALRQHIEAGHA